MGCPPCPPATILTLIFSSSTCISPSPFSMSRSASFWIFLISISFLVVFFCVIFVLLPIIV